MGSKDRSFTTYVPVAVGSAVGALARYAVSLLMLSLLGEGFPWGTLSVNGTGSFLIGLLSALLLGEKSKTSHATHQLLIAGFCGGFTTFSVFSLEVLLMLEEGWIGRAIAYLSSSIVLWLVMVWLGYWFGSEVRRSIRRSARRDCRKAP